MLKLGRSQYEPGSHVSQAHMAAVSQPYPNHIFEDFVPVGSDIIVQYNPEKTKTIYTLNDNVLEFLFFDKMPVGMKLYDRTKADISVISRSIDIQMDTLFETITDTNCSVYTSANAKSVRMAELFGEQLFSDNLLVNTMTSASHGVQVTDDMLADKWNDPPTTQLEYPYSYIDKSMWVDPYFRNAVYENNEWSRYPKRFIRNYLRSIPQINPTTCDRRLEIHPNAWAHIAFRHLIIKLYESKYTDLEMVMTDKKEFLFHGCNPVLGIATHIDDEGFEEMMLCTFKHYTHINKAKRISIHKTFREEGVIVVEYANHKDLMYFDTGVHLLCRCGIEEIIYNTRSYEYDRERFYPDDGMR